MVFAMNFGNIQMRAARGFVLLEVILAAGIFALAGTSLAVALSNLAKTWHQARQVEAVRVGLESRLAELRVTRLREGNETSDPDARGVVYETTVTRLEISNDEKIVLTGLYEISVSARWREGGEEQREKASVYVYQP
jgi:type II secretory pathway pseudopilin PulG